MKNKLLIIGASGHGKVVADVAVKMNKWQEIAFLDDSEKIKRTMGFNVVGKSSEAINHLNDYDIFVGIGNNDIRSKIQNQLQVEGASIPILIHPNATIGGQVNVGRGTVIMAGVVINCSTTIGEGCIINTGSTIDHDCMISDFVHISPGARLAGSVMVGHRTWLGIGTVVSNNISIVNSCKIGAGGVVIKDITEPGTYVGIPVRRVIKNEDSFVS